MRLLRNTGIFILFSFVFFPAAWAQQDAGEAGNEPQPLIIFNWEENGDGENWDLAGGAIDPIAASGRAGAGQSGAVLPVPGLGWFEKFQITIPEGDPRWSDYEFAAMDYRVGPDTFACDWLELALVLSTPGHWWFQTGTEPLQLDGLWHTVLWRYDPRVIRGAPMVLRIATSTGDAGTLFVDRFRLIPSRISYDFDDHDLNGWVLAEGSGLETRPERVFSGSGACRLFLPASTWHRAAWRTFKPGPELDALLACNRMSLVARRWFSPVSEGSELDPMLFRLRFRLVFFDGENGWVESETREIRPGIGWRTFLMPIDWTGLDGQKPVTFFVVTESFSEEELYLDAVRFLQVE
jgi:hypothetical protein